MPARQSAWKQAVCILYTQNFYFNLHLHFNTEEDFNILDSLE